MYSDKYLELGKLCRNLKTLCKWCMNNILYVCVIDIFLKNLDLGTFIAKDIEDIGRLFQLFRTTLH